MSLEATTQCSTLADGIAEVAQWFHHGSDWPLLAPAPRADWIALLRKSREQLCQTLGNCTRAEAEAVLRSVLFAQPEVPTVMGLVFDRTTAAQTRLASVRDVMQTGWTHPMAAHAFIVGMLDAQPWELPLMADLHACPELVMERYIGWLFQRPVYRAVGDDARYVAWLPSMLDFIRTQFVAPALKSRVATFANTLMRRLDISMVVHSDVALRDVLDARARLIETMTSTIETLRGARDAGPPPRPVDRRIRLGILLRTLMKHPDPLAFCSQFEHFDKDRYEIIVYSQDLVDRQCEHDIALYERMFGFIAQARTLNSLSVRQMIDRIHADDLDVFVYSYAAQIGASPVDLVVSARLARVQVLMNSFVPMATGLRSFTHVATVAPSAATRDSLTSEFGHAQLAEIPRVLLSYLPHTRSEPVRPIDRAALRIPADGIVLYNGGAVDKIVPVQLDAWVRALARVPRAWLVLAPFNPGWNGTRGAVNLSGLIDATCRTHKVDPRRIVVLRELSPRDTQQLYDMATVYLGTFPHGSSTSVALAMQSVVPAVTRRSPWLRGTGDASIVQSIGLDDLVAADANAYVDLLVRLATDRTYHDDVCARIRAALPTAPFLANRDYGRALQGMFDALAQAAFGYPLAESEQPVVAENSRAA